MAKPVHLVKNYHDVSPKKRAHLLWGSEKVDGVYGFFKQGQGYSRTGEEYCSWQDCADICNDRCPDHVVIGEWITMDNDGNQDPVNVISGNQRRQELYTGYWALVIHDVIPVEDFEAGLCETPFWRRLRDADPLLDHPYFVSNPQVPLAGQEAHEQYAADLIQQGKEGAVFKDPEGIWIAGKKNEMQMKIKCGVSYDLECVGIELGRPGTKYDGMFGKLVYRWTQGRTVSARGRISEEQGAAYLADPSTCIGKIFQVDGMCLTPEGMIREPVTIMERVDKETADV